MEHFLQILWHYTVEVVPALIIGFFLSGLIHEFVPEEWVEKNLGEKGLKGIFYATFIGALLPICCWGSLPVAVSFYKKGSKLGPVLAFLVATPATSVSALLVTYQLLGLQFAIFIFFAVMIMGMLMGIIGNQLHYTPKLKTEDKCPHCHETKPHSHRRIFSERMKSVLQFAFVDLMKEIGPQTALGILLAAIVATALPLGAWIQHNLSGFFGYIFALVFGLITYICSTATVPLVDALIRQGLAVGAGMTLLLVGPITSYGTILVLKKEFGTKITTIYLVFISISSLALGYLYSLL